MHDESNQPSEFWHWTRVNKAKSDLESLDQIWAAMIFWGLGLGFGGRNAGNSKGYKIFNGKKE